MTSQLRVYKKPPHSLAFFSPSLEIDHSFHRWSLLLSDSASPVALTGDFISAFFPLSVKRFVRSSFLLLSRGLSEP